jgi:DNA-directed RNA polymerase specialized sigma24 family protein
VWLQWLQFAVEIAPPGLLSIRSVASPTLHDSDFLFAESCLAGRPSAVEELRTGPLNLAERFMINAGIPIQDAAEVVRELWTDLLAAGDERRPLLQGYRGHCALTTWLNRVAFSRALFRKRTEDRRRHAITHADEQGSLVPDAPSVVLDPEAESMKHDTFLRDFLKEAIQRAFNGCSAEDFVMLFLLYAGSLQIQELSRMFDLDPKTVNSRAKTVCSQVRFAVMAEIEAKDPWLKLSFEDVLSLLQPDLPNLFGPGQGVVARE